MTRHKILILGGTGFVGTHLCARLVERNHAVRVLTRRRARAAHLRVLSQVEVLEGHPEDDGALGSALQGVTAVINLVGILNERGRSGAGFERAHVGLATRVVDACRKRSVGRLLHMSGLPAAEDGPSHYLRSKGRAESVVRSSGPAIGWTILRPSVIFGPGDSFLNRFAGLLRLLPVLPLARIDARLAPVYVGDVAEAFVRALEDPRCIGQSYDLCGPDVMTLGAIVRYVRDRLGLRRWVFGLPDPLGAVQAAMMELLPGKPLSLDNYRSLAVDSVSADDGLARLGIERTSLAAAVPLYFGQSRRAETYDANRRARSRA